MFVQKMKLDILWTSFNMNGVPFFSRETHSRFSVTDFKYPFILSVQLMET